MLFVLGAISLSSFAQEKSCNLQFGIYEFKEDGTSEQFPIRDSKIKLVNTKTNKALKVNKNATTNVAEGEYKITASKNGFQNTSKEFSVDCSLADAQNTVSEIVFLWKGNAKQTVNMSFDENFVVGEEYQEKNPENKIAVSLVKPEYPAAARAVRASGAVQVQVTINELGYVISAKAISGHPLLRSAAEKAGKASKFSQTLLEGMPVKVTGVVVYNFIP